MSNDYRILVTGGAGFIGSNIVDKLVSLDNVKKIVILDNLSTGKMNNINSSPKVEFIYGDISIYDTCFCAMNNINLICHQAAVGSVPKSIYNPLGSHTSNVTGFINILTAALKRGIKRIVFASSSSVYGDNTSYQKTEGNEGNLLSPYAATKYIDEIYADVFNRCYGMECIGLRYFNVFGPRQDADNPYAAVIPKFIKIIKNKKIPTINGDGSFTRDFTYIDNVVNANISALFLNMSSTLLDNYNIGTGSKISMIELVQHINHILGFEDPQIIFAPEREGDVPHSCADISKASRNLNYKVQVQFLEGLQKLISCTE